MKKHYIIITTIIVSLLIWCSVFFLMQTKTQAWIDTVPTGVVLGSTSFYNSLPATVTSKRWLLEWFCNAAISQREWFLSDDRTLYYAPKNSLFLAALCSPILWEERMFFNQDLLSDAIKENNRPRAFLGTIPRSCDPDPENDMGNCDMSRVLPIIFAAAMNDHSTLSMAWRVLTDDNIDDTIAWFSDKYFGWWKSLWCVESSSIFLGTKSASNQQEAICSHPKTNTLLKETIEQLQKQQKNLKTISADEIAKTWKDVVCTDDTTNKNDLFLCSYTSHHPNANVQAGNQYNVWYNEVFYYKLLITRISQKLSADESVIKPLNLTRQQISSSTSIENSAEIENLAREVVISQQALVTMQKTLDNFRATFPLHIWLNAYYEDVLQVRKWLAKVYTPINQLYYKLRNIQQKQ